MDDDIPQPEERAAFFTLLEDEHIQYFLARDSCLKISDKYLLAMVLTYFRRANLRTEEYRTYFFPSLFLANQFEEEEFFRREIYPWALGLMWMIQKKQLHHLRDQMLIRMGFRAWVERETCDLIMAQDPDHCTWKRERKVHHSWAIRQCRRDNADFTITDARMGNMATGPPRRRIKTGQMKTWIKYILYVLPTPRTSQKDVIDVGFAF
ncbi:speedy protein 1-B-like [Bufo gargarizans]|uniref:speedy protein 1-B-like n=1 Tax=Bufo gargarizans TaxID=30331 RepID=UPI001CF20269|nr:speedy protein 1-B-like [Bufo gargarizans]